jgi:hypothetical protein
VNLVIHFADDFENYMRRNLTANGFKHIPAGGESLYVHYCNVMRRRIPKHKRKIQRSDVFECPKNLRPGLQRLEAAVVKGEDLTPWQSKNILNTGYNDRMCNNFGIYHLHLGETKEDDSIFIVRTDLVLYCLVDYSNIYCLQILEHGEKQAGELVAIAKHNWPYISSQDENAGLDALTHADRLRSLLSQYENHVKENVDKFARQIKRVAGVEPANLEFHLHVDDETGIAYAEEFHSKIRFKLGLV